MAPLPDRTFLGHGWQRRQASDVQGSTWSTTKRRDRRILPPAVSVLDGAGHSPA